MTPAHWAAVQHRHPAGRDPGDRRAVLADVLGGAARGCCKREPAAIRFVRNMLVAFLPAAVIGLALHKQIEALLGNAPVGRGRADRRRHRDLWDRAARPRRATSSGVADIPLPQRARDRLHPVPGDGAGGQPLGRDDPRRAEPGRRAADRGGVQLLPRHPDDARRDRARAGQATGTNWRRRTASAAG